MKISSERVEMELNAEDIEGLLRLGTPTDEYSGEARDIAAALEVIESSRLGADVVTATISLIWTKSFDLSDDDMLKRLPAIRNVASRLVCRFREREVSDS